MKLLFVGLGGAGQRHLRSFRAILGESAAYLAYRRRGAPTVIGPDFNLVPGGDLRVATLPSLEAAFCEQPDAVIVSNPTSMHVSTALAAAQASAHVLIEKPLSHCLDGVAELDRVLGEQDRVGLVGYMMRFHPCLRQIRAWLDEGRLGKLFSARLAVSSYVPEWHPWEDYQNLYAVRRELGGGVVLTESHELDMAGWFFGRPKRVFAMGGALSGRSGDVEDTASILLDYGFPVNVLLCFMQRPPSRSCEINGELGKIVWQGGNAVELLSAGERIVCEFENHQRAHLFRDQAKHFLACIAGRERPIADVRAASQTLEIARAALTSIENGEVVYL